MKWHDLKTIQKFAKDLWRDDDTDYRDLTIEAYIKPEEYVELEVHRMYEAPGLTFAKLKKIAEFFETENINDVDQIRSGGCETCDYGSKYGFRLRIRPEKQD